MKLYTINTGFFKLDGGAMFGVVPKTIWEHINPPDEKNLCTWAMRCLLVDTGSRRILIDTGLGNKQSPKFFSYYEPHGTDTLLTSLAQYGYKPEDISDVILTHLHFDHCGGAVRQAENGQLQPLFPNAVYWSNVQHWEAALNPNAREKASFLKENFVPLAENGLIRHVKDGDFIAEGVHVEFVYGHTQAMMLPHIAYRGTTLVYLADLIPSVGHIKLPYVMGYDTQPLITLQEKARFLQKAAREKHLLFFEHDPTTACIEVLFNERGDVVAGNTQSID